MKRPEDIIIKRVLNNRGTTREAKDVAAWLGTMDGQKWLKASLENDALEIESGLIPLVADNNVDAILKRVFDRIKRRRRLNTVLIAAAVLIPCVLVTGLWMNINKHLGGVLTNSSGQEAIVAARGDIETIVFQDGTRVKLNSGSQLTYPHYFGLKDRTVYLKGEALFEVSKNSGRPFIVVLDKKNRIEVTGTSFNVMAYDYTPIIDISLFEGEVSFISDNKSYEVKQSQHLVYNRATGKGQLCPLVLSQDDIPWINRVLVFKDTPIKDVVHMLMLHYDVDISLSSGLNGITYSFQTESEEPIESILNDMSRLSDIRVTKKDAKSFIISR